MPQFFNGKFVIAPQVSVAVNNSQLQNLNSASPNTLALIGPASGGVPQSPFLVSDPVTAREKLQKGDLLEAALLAFAPSSVTGGASNIYLVRVNSAVQSKVKIFDINNPTPASWTVTVGGTVATSDVFTITYAGATVTYTATGSDSTTTVATALAAAFNNSTDAVIKDALTGATATSSGSVVTLTTRYSGVSLGSTTVTSNTTGAATLVTASSAAGTGNYIISLVSNDYGAYTNQLYYNITTGSTSGYKVTLGVLTNNGITGSNIVQDNISRNLFTLQYTGGGSAATVTLTDSALTTNVTGAPADNLNVNFSVYNTIQSVVDYINSTGKYTATLSSTVSSPLPSYQQFDPYSAQDVKTSAFTLTANIQAVVDFLNSTSNPYCTATRVASITSTSLGTSALNVYFVGGSDGTTASQDWTNAINSLQGVDDVDIIVPVTNQAAYHASVSAHCNYMSGLGKYRRAIVGGASGEYSSSSATPTSAITARALALNSTRVLQTSPGVNFYDSTNTLQKRGAEFTAALVGGIAASVGPGVALTGSYLTNIASLEVNFLPSDIQSLLLGGVCPIQYVKNQGYKIVQSRTTWLSDNNFANVEWSTAFVVDEVSRRINDGLSTLIGKPVSPTTLSLAVSITETILKKATSDGLLVGDVNSPPFKNIMAQTPGGDTINVQGEISPAIPDNYINVSLFTTPYTGTVSSAS